MKNFKKMAFGLLAGALAIGASAFATVKHGRLTDYTFVHVAHTTSNDRADYIYRGTPAGCSSSSNNCKSVWSQADAPAEGDNPEPDAVQGAITNGNYLGM